MAINLLGSSNINNAINNTLVNGSINAANQAENEAVKQLLGQIKEFLPGQIIEGKLLEVDGNAAKLLLNNNLVLNTQIQSDANLSAGQKFSFEIQSNNGKQLQIRPLFTNVSADSTAVKALESASVKISEETLKMVDSLMKEGMPINKETLASINRDLNAFPGADVESIVLLHKLNIPVNEHNIEQMSLYNNNNRWMMESVDSLADNLTDAIVDALKGENDKSAFLNELKNIFGSADTSLNGNEELSKAMDLFDKLKNLPEQKLDSNNILKHIKNDLTTILKDKFLMDPSEVSDKQNVKQYYNKTLEVAQRLEQLLSNEGKNDNAAVKDLNNIRNNISFMNDINEMFNYIQLPLKMADSQANGDLYVYRRNKSSEQEDGPLTALLHLSMETLGNMDIFLKLDQSKLSTKFCLEKEEMIDFIEQHIDELNVRLIDKGYNIDTSVGKMEEKEQNVIDLIQGKKEEIQIISTQSFDARA